MLHVHWKNQLYKVLLEKYQQQQQTSKAIWKQGQLIDSIVTWLTHFILPQCCLILLLLQYNWPIDPRKQKRLLSFFWQIKHSYDLWEGKMDPCERPATSHHLSWLTSGSGFQRGVTLSPLCYIVLFTHKTTVTKMLFIKGKKTRQNGTNSCSVSRLYINITLRMGLKMKVGKL